MELLSSFIFSDCIEDVVLLVSDFDGVIVSLSILIECNDDLDRIDRIDDLDRIENLDGVKIPLLLCILNEDFDGVSIPLPSK